MVSDDVRLAARHALWRRGDLKWKLHSTQVKLYDLIHDKRRFYLSCSRRLGKSFLLVCMAFEYALKNPGSRISYAAPTQKDATQIVSDLVAQILIDCPEDLRPEFYTADKEYRFKNGSIVRFSGVNAEHHENLRGRAAHLFLLDEVSQMDSLSYLLQSIVGPMVITTAGRVIMASTPPRSPGHDSIKISEKMAAKGEMAVFTLLDAPHIPNSEKAEALEQAGEDPLNIPDILAGKMLPQGTTALREFWCQNVTDSDTAVVPEFTAQVQRETVIDWQRPQYFDVYSALDPGMADNTGVLTGYWDFINKKLVICGELLLKRASTDTIARDVKQLEEGLWGTKQPLVRVSDLDLRLMQDLIQNHGLVFTPANRQDSLGAVDLVRDMVRRRELIIDPKCTGLVRQLRHATWNRKATDFERTQEDAHFDLLAALKMLCRVVVRNRNPFPSWFGEGGFGTYRGDSGSTPTKTVFTNSPLGRRLKKKYG